MFAASGFFAVRFSRFLELLFLNTAGLTEIQRLHIQSIINDIAETKEMNFPFVAKIDGSMTSFV